MLELIIAGYDVAPWVTGFNVDSSPAESDGFKNHDGTTVYGSGGSIVKLDIRLGRVPTDISNRLAAAVESGDTDISYTSPTPTSAKFIKKRYQASAKAKGSAWDISMSFESAAPVGGDRL